MSLVVLGDFFYGYDGIQPDLCRIAELCRRKQWKVMLNLEGSIIDAPQKKIKKRGEHLAQSSSTLQTLEELGVVGVSIANNHIFDFFEEGLQATRMSLKRVGIEACGAGKDLEEAAKPMTICDGEYTYEVYAATDSFEEAICADATHAGCYPIRQLLEADIPTEAGKCRIAFLHTGFEYNTLPSLRTIRECRMLIDKGFDYVICSHPHLMQPYEIYRGRPIFYSIGNFYFSQFREEFEHKRIVDKQPGYCNLGLGVVLSGLQYTCLGVGYDTSGGTSYLEENTRLEELPDSSLDVYKKNYRKHRNNHNPHLMGDWRDAVKMQVLYALYAAYRLVRRIIRR